MISSSELRGARRGLLKLCVEAAPLRTRAQRPAPSAPFPRAAFTLVELLVTIAIIAILAAAMLGASNAAMESARVSKTKSTIAKIDGLLMQRYQSYTTRRVNINPTVIASFGGQPTGQQMADLRLLALRELMALEMPDRWSDVLGMAVPESNPGSVTAYTPRFLAGRPSLASAYLRRYYALTSNSGGVITSNQGAECLYMVVMLACGDGESRTLFTDAEIGDTDGDGAFEFLDGWGQPISYLRSPPGYAERSSLMTSLQPFIAKGSTLAQALLLRGEQDHDPFDPFRRDDPMATVPPGSPSYPNALVPYVQRLRDANPAFRLTPLIYSSGADGISDIHSQKDFLTGLDPYGNTSKGMPIGTPGDAGGNGDGVDNSIDNITNQDIQQ